MKVITLHGYIGSWYKEVSPKVFKWCIQEVFYNINPEIADLQNNWRFCEVKDRRTQLKPTGTTLNITI